MSNHNNIYNILGKLNAVEAKNQPKPADIKKQTPKTQLQENMEQVLSRKLISEKKAKPDYIDLDKDGNKKETMKKAAADKKKNAFDPEVAKSMFAPEKGKTKTGHDVKDTGYSKRYTKSLKDEPEIGRAHV